MVRKGNGKTEIVLSPQRAISLVTATLKIDDTAQ